MAKLFTFTATSYEDETKIKVESGAIVSTKIGETIKYPVICAGDIFIPVKISCLEEAIVWKETGILRQTNALMGLTTDNMHYLNTYNDDNDDNCGVIVVCQWKIDNDTEIAIKNNNGVGMDVVRLSDKSDRPMIIAIPETRNNRVVFNIVLTKDGITKENIFIFNGKALSGPMNAEDYKHFEFIVD